LLPTTPTNKVLTRTLVQQKFRSDLVGADPVYLYQRQERTYRSFTLEDEQVLQREFESNGRVQAWNL
jgi:hypothetical protein